MRVIVFYDLPMVTTEDLKAYRSFRRILEYNGFQMLQESVYTKIALDGRIAREVVAKLRKEKPSKGIVQILLVTEKQFTAMECLVGQYHSDTINTNERFIVL